LQRDGGRGKNFAKHLRALHVRNEHAGNAFAVDGVGNEA